MGRESEARGAAKRNSEDQRRRGDPELEQPESLTLMVGEGAKIA